MKWIGRILLVLVLGLLGIVGWWGTYLYRTGVFAMPDLPAGALYLSRREGFRAIILEVPEEYEQEAERGPPGKIWRSMTYIDPERGFFQVPFEVPSYLEKTWSYCAYAPEGSKEYFEETFPVQMKRELALARLDYVCTIEVDDREVTRGLIYSVPRP